MTLSFRDEKSRTYNQIANHNLCIDGARKIGAIVVNLGAEDLMEGKPYLVFGLLWQVIKIGMLREVTLEKHPELLQLQEGDEEDLKNLPAEELLLKWLNWHLKKSIGQDFQVENFSADIHVRWLSIH
jgi:plastin-1